MLRLKNHPRIWLGWENSIQSSSWWCWVTLWQISTSMSHSPYTRQITIIPGRIIEETGPGKSDIHHWFKLNLSAIILNFGVYHLFNYIFSLFKVVFNLFSKLLDLFQVLGVKFYTAHFLLSYLFSNLPWHLAIFASIISFNFQRFISFFFNLYYFFMFVIFSCSLFCSIFFSCN